MDIEKRTVTLNVTKTKLTDGEAKELTGGGGGGNCGEWFLEEIPGYGWCSCRICYQGYPTQWPYKECVQLPE